MKIIEKQYENGIELGIIDTKKFKKNVFLVSYALPLTEVNASNAAVLANVLERGCEKYKNITEMNRALCSLYDASVDVGTSSCGKALLFNVSVSVLDDRYALEGDGGIFSKALDFIKEMLFSPLAKDGALDTGYVESEKKRITDIIKADINNKDRYALKRMTEIAYEGTPLAISSKGSASGVAEVTPRSAYEMLRYITERCVMHAVFAGDCTDERKKELDTFLCGLSDMRNGCVIENTEAAFCPPSFDKTKEVTETVDARQGRMVLNYSFKSRGEEDASPMIFDEIFGASPVSRLFMNVRERLSLCYYCASSAYLLTSRMIVRSGIDIANREKAMNEISRQLSLLSDAENISAEELEIAKKSRISTYTALGDSGAQYASWYIMRRISGFGTDVDAIISRIRSVSAEDVAEIARSVRLEVSYFLDGSQRLQA